MPAPRATEIHTIAAPITTTTTTTPRTPVIAPRSGDGPRGPDATHALGHLELSTTLGIYGHRDGSDLGTAMQAYARWLEDEAPSVPPEEGS